MFDAEHAQNVQPMSGSSVAEKLHRFTGEKHPRVAAQRGRLYNRFFEEP
jgi:hypothetical protein